MNQTTNDTPILSQRELPTTLSAARARGATLIPRLRRDILEAIGRAEASGDERYTVLRLHYRRLHAAPTSRVFLLAAGERIVYRAPSAEAIVAYLQGRIDGRRA